MSIEQSESSAGSKQTPVDQLQTLKYEPRNFLLVELQ